MIRVILGLIALFFSFSLGAVANEAVHARRRAREDNVDELDQDVDQDDQDDDRLGNP
jgi:hypothetical protein